MRPKDLHINLHIFRFTYKIFNYIKWLTLYTADLKSVFRKEVPVRVQPPTPVFLKSESFWAWFDKTHWALAIDWSREIKLVKLSHLSQKTKSMKMENRAFVILAIVGIVLFIVLFYVNKLELFPATLFSATTLAFSYLAYKFSKEKFCLDLFEKRWVVYKSTLEFCSKVTQQGPLSRTDSNKEEFNATMKAANQSFRGLGWHKTRALFGDEIYVLFDKLNESYAWLLAFSEPPANPATRSEWPQKMQDHTLFIWETVNKLPGVFKPYMYFGDYRR